MTDDSVSGWRLLRTRDFGFLWSGQVVSQVGDGLNKVALLWFVYALTGSALKMTVIGLVQTICPLIFGPIIGVYLDRISKKWLMIWTDVARTIMVLLIPLLHATGALTLERLYILVFIGDERMRKIAHSGFLHCIGFDGLRPRIVFGDPAYRDPPSAYRRERVDAGWGEYRRTRWAGAQRAGNCVDRGAERAFCERGHLPVFGPLPHSGSGARSDAQPGCRRGQGNGDGRYDGRLQVCLF